jgi:hypothetical protein
MAFNENSPRIRERLMARNFPVLKRFNELPDDALDKQRLPSRTVNLRSVGVPPIELRLVADVQALRAL